MRVLGLGMVGTRRELALHGGTVRGCMFRAWLRDDNLETGALQPMPSHVVAFAGFAVQAGFAGNRVFVGLPYGVR
eukprot:7365982-Pyramimonas_sp.AAC.1